MGIVRDGSAFFGTLGTTAFYPLLVASRTWRFILTTRLERALDKLADKNVYLLLGPRTLNAFVLPAAPTGIISFDFSASFALLFGLGGGIRGAVILRFRRLTRGFNNVRGGTDLLLSFEALKSLYRLLPCLSGGVFPDNIPFEPCPPLSVEGSKVRERADGTEGSITKI